MNKYIITAMAFLPISVIADHHELSYYEPTMSFQTSKVGDTWVGTLSGTVQATEEINLGFEVDSTGYLELGSGYGMLLGETYTEAFATYGRADLVDIYNLGVFAGKMLTNEVLIFGSTSYEWRKSVFQSDDFPILSPNFNTHREWKASIGTSYTPINWLNFSYSLNHERIMSETTLEPSIYHADFTLTFKPKYIEPYVKYRYGQHRVRPGEPRTTEGTYEFGFNLNFK
ncbi:hypothetical protein [Vibrio mediterranei]|uniref:hypothetical protein n=1 Tax=Vibrio mediterranei TaxID=689 RepID=UPI00148BD079|nr:hypothetical protein [Vibrio mediterranei]NOI23290.1 hypothetical protein [Vibrio mediterranei]